jgi:hypothetical protein
LPAFAQLRGVQEAPVRAQVLRERLVERTRHVAGNRIQGLVAAGEAVRAAGVDQRDRALRQAALDPRRVHRAVEFARSDGSGPDYRHAGVQRVASRAPGGETAIQHLHQGVTAGAQQPPQPRSDRAVGLVIRNDQRSGLEAPLAQRARERGGDGSGCRPVAADRGPESCCQDARRLRPM